MVPAQTLHFKSGFEPGTAFVAAGEDLTGVDNSVPSGTPRDWVADLDNDARLGNFNFQIQSATGGATATLVNDPTGSGRGKVLRYWMQTPNDIKGRIQSNIYGSAPDLNEVTSAVKMYFHPDLGVLEDYDTGFSWFTLQEIWTNPTWTNDLRVSIDLARKSTAEYPNATDHKLYWHARGSINSPGTTFWRAETFGTDGHGIWVSDILGQWVTLVTYFKKGDETTGKFKAKIIKANGTIMQLFDFTGRTTHPDPATGKQTGFTHHNTFKMYADKNTFNYVRNNTQGGNGASIIYWDDWEYYEGDAYTNYGGVGTWPTVPSSLTATATSSTQVNLAWPDVANETRYFIERKSMNDAGYKLLTTKAAGSTTHSDTTAVAKTNYTYRIRAGNAGGNSTYRVSNTITTPPGVAFQMSTNQVVMEAERPHARTGGGGFTWTEITQPGGSVMLNDGSSLNSLQAAPNNGSYVSAPGTGTCRAEYRINIPSGSASAFYVHVRCRGATSSDDSLFISMNNSTASFQQINPPVGTALGWVRSASTFALSAGTHIVSLWMREDGAIVDKFVVSSSATLPTGTGPAQSPSN
jgi:hypothetical protein